MSFKVEKKSIVIEFSLSVLKDLKHFDALVEQLAKDILLAGLDADDLTGDNPEDYINSLSLFLRENLRSNPEKLRALFYRVDIKESEIVSLFEPSLSNTRLLDELLKALIIRELQKIDNRMKFL